MDQRLRKDIIRTKIVGIQAEGDKYRKTTHTSGADSEERLLSIRQLITQTMNYSFLVFIAKQRKSKQIC